MAEEGRSMSSLTYLLLNHDLVREVLAWQAQQFPERTAHSIATHLAEEAAELARDPYNAKETADVFMLYVALLHFTGLYLDRAVALKLEENKARTWEKPDKDGVVRHIKEE